MRVLGHERLVKPSLFAKLHRVRIIETNHSIFRSWKDSRENNWMEIREIYAPQFPHRRHPRRISCWQEYNKVPISIKDVYMRVLKKTPGRGSANGRL